MASCDLLEWAYKVLHCLEHVCFGFWAFSPCDRALIFLVSGPSPPSLMSGDVMPCHIRIWARFQVIPTCPPINGKTPKLMEIVSSKALCLSLVIYFGGFYASIGG